MGNIHNDINFIDVMKQNGVGSVGTLYRECIGRVVFFAVKDLIRSNKIGGGCYTQYHNVNEYVCASITGRGAGFWSVSYRQIKTSRINTKSIILPLVSRTSSSN